jgi:hypothetical protein
VLAEQPRRELLVGATQLRPFQRDRPGGRLDRRRGVAVARAGVGAFPAGVPLTAEELGDLGLQRGLQDQSGAEAGDVLQHLAEVAIGGEQAVDVVTDAVGG